MSKGLGVEANNSDIKLEIEEGKKNYIDENNKNPKIELNIEKIRNQILAIDFDNVPFTESDIKNITSPEVLDKILKRLNITREEYYYIERDKKKLILNEEEEWKNKNRQDLEGTFFIGEPLSNIVNPNIPEFINNKSDKEENFNYKEKNKENRIIGFIDSLLLFITKNEDVDIKYLLSLIKSTFTKYI